jgi:hypothetical protein
MTGRTFEYLSKDGFPHNLPYQFTSFVGREREKQELARLLAPRVCSPSPAKEGLARLASRWRSPPSPRMCFEMEPKDVG